MPDQNEIQILRPKLTFFGGEFRNNFEIEIDSKGRIGFVGAVRKPEKNDGRILRLPEEALVPGLCNAHSHAFQRCLRGVTQTSGPSGKDSFWTWREAMYRTVQNLTPDDVYTVSALAFLEMVSTGITLVGEFHYLHHDPNGSCYANANELGLQVLRAARDVGIRICLLDVAYERGGWQTAIGSAQKRFVDLNVETYLKRVDALSKEVNPNEGWGVAPHSIRAVGKDWLQEIIAFNRDKHLPVHMHLHEQPRELEECKAEFSGLSPIEVLENLGGLTADFTAVHATHTTARDRNLLAKTKVGVCACPTTERDLGDGILDADLLGEHKTPLCLGTDSQVLINLWEDARELEYHLRLKHLERNVLHNDVSQFLFNTASANGAQALHFSAGKIQQGNLADLVSLDLNHLSLQGATEKTLLTHIIFSMQPAAVKRVFVGGRIIKDDTPHPLVEKIGPLFLKLQRRLSGR